MKDFRPTDAVPAPPQLVGRAAQIMTARQSSDELRLFHRLQREEKVMEIEENRIPALRTFQLEQIAMSRFRDWLVGHAARAIQDTRAGYLEELRQQRARDKEEEELWGSDTEHTEGDDHEREEE